MNKKIKSKIKLKNIFYKQYIHNGQEKKSDFIVLENLITEFNELIISTKALYFENLGES